MILHGEDILSQLGRILVMYLFVIIMLRLAGKRRIAHLTPADMIIIISLGSAVGDVIVYPESVVRLGSAMVAVAAIVAFQIILTKLTEKNQFASHLIEGDRTKVISNGIVDRKALDNEDLSMDDLGELLAEKGVASASLVREAYLERSGELSVFLKPIRKRGHRHE
jgi:uncharacterized membrane protein YcaP (DUF421 family)